MAGVGTDAGLADAASKWRKNNRRQITIKFQDQSISAPQSSFRKKPAAFSAII
jgi:hypothetical protein